MAKKLVFTGGHHVSSLVVAKELKAKDWEIIWFGHQHSMWGDKADSAEYQEVTTAGIKFYDLQAGKFYRTFNPLKLVRIPWGFLQATYWLLKEQPSGIVSFGGYLAVPTVIMGWVLGIKSITHEQTVVTGWANKLLAHFVVKIAVTWPTSLKYYPAHKVVLVGLPIRQELLKTKNSKPKKPLLYITGGKQGSHTLNEVVFASLEKLENYDVLHQTGNNDLDKAKSWRQKNYECFDFDSQKAIWALQSADIVVSRAGAHIIYELAVLGKRSVLIPLSSSSHREQEINAQMLADAGAAIVLTEAQLTPENLQNSIREAERLTPKPMHLPLDSSAKMMQLVELELG